MRIRVAVLASDLLSAESMRALLEKSSSIEADCCCTVAALERRVAGDRVDAIVWFTRRAGADGLADLRELRERAGLPLCVVAERVDVPALREALATRPEGIAVVTRAAGTDVQAVFRSLVQLLAGSVSLTAGLLDELLKGDMRGRDDPLGTLTASELAVLELVALGLRNSAIATRLGRSRKLVEKQVGRVFGKLGLRHDEVPDLDRRVTAARLFLLGGELDSPLAEPVAGVHARDPRAAEAAEPAGSLPELAVDMPALEPAH